MNYRAALAWLFNTQRFGIKLGLESSHRLFASLGVATIPGKIIHVAGTNGKGSVCALLDAIGRAAGFRTGLFTSPHLVSFRERIQVDGEMITEDAVARGLTNIRDLLASWEPHPTFFEIVTALALVHFRDTAPDLVILETGMGGRLDSTNATNPVVSVLTPIDYDHQKWLGHTLTEIAGEKAGIIKAGVPVISAQQPAEAAEVIRAKAEELGSPLTIVKSPMTKFPIALIGEHQKQNAALAVAAFQAAEIFVSEDAVEEGLAKVSWPARFQRWDERTIIDGAHNPAGARALVRAWKDNFGERKATLILAILADKDVASFISTIAPIVGRVLLPQIRSERALPAEELSLTIKGLLAGVPVKTAPSFAAAWQAAQRTEGLILITGSLHFAGEALAELRGEPAAYEECLQ